MKSIKYLLIPFITVIIIIPTACGDSSTNPQNNNNRIVGTWELVSMVITVNGKQIDATEVDPCLLTTVLIFKPGGDFRTTYATNTGTGSDECSEETSVNGTWEFEGGTTYTIHGGRLGSDTRTLTFSDDNNAFSFSVENTLDEFQGKATITYERQ